MSIHAGDKELLKEKIDKMNLNAVNHEQTLTNYQEEIIRLNNEILKLKHRVDDNPAVDYRKQLWLETFKTSYKTGSATVTHKACINAAYVVERFDTFFSDNTHD